MIISRYKQARFQNHITEGASEISEGDLASWKTTKHAYFTVYNAYNTLKMI